MSYSIEHIITVTAGGLLYRDEEGRVCWADFVECNRNWQLSRRQLTLFDKKCVGWRNTGDGKVLDVEMFTEPRLRFVFWSYLERDQSLLNPMQARGGWYTLDMLSD